MLLKKILLLSPEPLSSLCLQKVLARLRDSIAEKYLGAANLIQVSWREVLPPKGVDELLEYCRQWATGAYLVTPRHDACFPEAGWCDPLISKSPLSLPIQELEAGLFCQDLTPFKYGLMSQWLKTQSAFEVFGFEGEVTEPTAEQIRGLQELATQNRATALQSLQAQHAGRYFVISAAYSLVGATTSLEAAELLAREYLDRCNIYGPAGEHLGERWHGR
jgi:hypothetical protein